MDRWLESLQKSTAPARSHAAPKEANVPLEFRELALVDDGAVGGEDDFGKAANEPQDLVGAFLEKTTLAVLMKSPGVADESWDAPLAKRESPTPPAKKIASYEIVTIDGERWTRAYDADGGLVDQRMLRPEIA